jgi:serine/threonine protein kinase/tetratricopeptide (TPR) repeat protein
MIGTTISHYRILEKLGEGGMGVVYRAEDTKLRRPVALKFVSPRVLGSGEEQVRFLREAQAAAALNHPSICTVHEIDEADGLTFIAMEYVEGQTLRARIDSGPLSMDESARLASRIAEGLAAAHSKGIIHRDIKPSNILLTPTGQVRITDFGLARLSGTTEITRRGTMTGTLAYMSPEQIRGAEIDHRADIWSLGVVLYEMLTGRRPFRGERDGAVLYSILNEDAARPSDTRPDVVALLERVVFRMLSKDPSSRHADAEEVIDDLAGIASGEETIAPVAPTGGRESRPSVAVLPFADMSPDRDQEYFCDGMAEELINALTHVDRLRVSSRTSSFQFKGGGQDIRDIGRKLGVRSVLEGSVRKAGARLRITAQLVSCADGCHIWSERFDRDMEDVFAIQDEISLAIVDALRPELLGEERAKLVRHPTADPEAYNLYLQGRWFWKKRTHDGLMKAIEYFERAISVAPDFALAYTGIADSYNDLLDYSSSPPDDAFERARSAALRALEIDDTLPEAHASLGLLKSEHEWDWDGAEREFRRAIGLNPRYASAHQWYAHLLLNTVGPEEALEEYRRALELEPHSLSINRNYGYMLLAAGRDDEAIAVLRRTLEMEPDFIYTHLILAMVHALRGMFDEALAELLEEERVVGGWHPLVEGWRGIVQALSGSIGPAEDTLQRLIEVSSRGYVPASQIALLCFALDRRDEGFEWLERARTRGDAHLFLSLCMFRRRAFAGGDLRLAEFLAKLGLEP